MNIEKFNLELTKVILKGVLFVGDGKDNTPPYYKDPAIGPAFLAKILIKNYFAVDKRDQPIIMSVLLTMKSLLLSLQFEEGSEEREMVWSRIEDNIKSNWTKEGLVFYDYTSELFLIPIIDVLRKIYVGVNEEDYFTHIPKLVKSKSSIRSFDIDRETGEDLIDLLMEVIRDKRRVFNSVQSIDSVVYHSSY